MKSKTSIYFVIILVFDSSIVTKHQVKSIEKYIEQIRCDDVEIVKFENPLRFVVQNKTTHSVVTTIPHEFNDCLLTLISHSDPLRKSEIIDKCVSAELSRDIKDNSLDIRSRSMKYKNDKQIFHLFSFSVIFLVESIMMFHEKKSKMMVK